MGKRLNDAYGCAKYFSTSCEQEQQILLSRHILARSALSTCSRIILSTSTGIEGMMVTIVTCHARANLTVGICVDSMVPFVRSILVSRVTRIRILARLFTSFRHLPGFRDPFPGCPNPRLF